MAINTTPCVPSSNCSHTILAKIKYYLFAFVSESELFVGKMTSFIKPPWSRQTKLLTLGNATSVLGTMKLGNNVGPCRLYFFLFEQNIELYCFELYSNVNCTYNILCLECCVTACKRICNICNKSFGGKSQVFA